jgi:hypothetical protein
MKSECPYRTLPRYGWWDDTNADQVEDVSLIVSPKFVIDRNSKIATSGSCFAQHLGRYLKLGSHCHFVTEMPLELMTDDEVPGIRKNQHGAKENVLSIHCGHISNREVMCRWPKWSVTEAIIWPLCVR